ncbi:MAG: hypothetical protein QOH96_27 [Blastocatellia bacterium]|nr:hypothetical protein [Blastocatellia bacterium]
MVSQMLPSAHNTVKGFALDGYLKVVYLTTVNSL